MKLNILEALITRGPFMELIFFPSIRRLATIKRSNQNKQSHGKLKSTEQGDQGFWFGDNRVLIFYSMKRIKV